MVFELLVVEPRLARTHDFLNGYPRSYESVRQQPQFVLVNPLVQ